MRQSIFSSKIRELRQNACYTQADVSRKLNIQRQTYCNYENALRTPPLEIIVALAELYHVSVDYLVRDDDAADMHYAGIQPDAAASLHTPAQRLLGEFASLSENSQKEVFNFIQFKKMFSE